MHCAVRAPSPKRELTHLVVPIFALSSRANERVKPWLDTVADNSMQTFVWCLVGGMSSVEIGKFRWYRSEEQRTFDFVPSLYDVDNACTLARESRDTFIKIAVKY